MKATLTRSETSDLGTFGELIVTKDDGTSETFCTGELPERDNKPMKSCVPVGIYHCLWTMSPHFQRDTYELQSVPERSAIRIHPANWMGDETMGYECQLDGCIALGFSIGPVGGQKGVRDSKVAVKKFESLFSGTPFELEIKEAFTQL